jgi:hypothetical protein
MWRSRYEERYNFSEKLSIFFLLSVILFTAHMLSCFWYLAGDDDQTFPNGVRVPGCASPVAAAAHDLSDLCLPVSGRLNARCFDILTSCFLCLFRCFDLFLCSWCFRVW